MRGPATRVGTVFALAVVALLTACTSQPVPTSTMPPTTSATATQAPLGDGILRIGTLFPSTGGTAFLGAQQVAAVKAAVAEINTDGGVNGKPVELVVDDSGDASTKTAEASVADFVKKGVDVIIGPSSSVLAERLLTPAEQARIPMVSPAATYPQLTTLDVGNEFFRTIPSSSHQGVALGALLPTKKQFKVALIASGDLIGQSISAGLHDTLAAHGGSLVSTIALSASSDSAAIAAKVKTAAPDAVVLDTADNGAQTQALITQLVAAGYGGAKLWLTSQNLADYSQALPSATLAGLAGASGLLEGADASAAFQAQVKAADPSVGSFQYAPEAYDATILVALAATLAHDDAGLRVAAQLQAASIGGIKCATYAECLDVLKTEPAIDYDGISGTTNLDAAGDVTSGSYGVFTYAPDGKYSRTATVTG